MLQSTFLLITFFFFTDTATTEIYTLSLHDALPISERQPPLPRHPDGDLDRAARRDVVPVPAGAQGLPAERGSRDRKSTRLNSSHVEISYAVFCLKKKKKKKIR